MIKSIRNNLGLVLICILAVLPLAFWLSMMPLANRFTSSLTTFRSLGQMAGLLGMAMLSINFVLSARFKVLDKLFIGLKKVYVRHHSIGLIAFCLILFHPVFLTIQYLFISLNSSFIFIFSIQDWPVNFGKLAITAFIVLMVITLYLNFKYQNWKSTHKYMGIVLLLASVHMLLIPSDVSNNAVLKYYMLSLAILGGASYLYRTIFGVYKKGEYRYELKEVIKINENVAELKLVPLGETIKFLPGQFVFIRFEDKGVLSESHPFSISSPYSQENGLSLGIKTLGDYTSMLYLMKPGAICRIEGPFGAFSYKKAKSKRQIWVAGGIGITPFLGMARQINSDIASAANYKIDLYYAVKNPNEAAFAEELSEIARRNNNFKFYQHFSEKDGHISARLIKSDGDINGAEIFLCGPLSFMRSLRNQFVEIGFDNGRIHSEEFNLY